MKLQELNQNEMTEINGGALLGGSNLIQGNLIGPVTIGSLLALSVDGQNGVSAALSTGGLTTGGLTNLLGSLGGLGNGLNLGGILGGLGS